MALYQIVGQRLRIPIPRLLWPGRDGSDFARPDGPIQTLRSGKVGARKLQVGPSLPKTDAVKRSVAALVFALILVGLMFMLTFELFATGRPLIASFYGDLAVRSGQLGDDASSVRYFKRAVWFDPKRVGLRLELARAYEETGADEEALKEYQQVIDLSPHAYEAYIRVAQLCNARGGDYGATLEVVERAFQQNPQEASVRYSLYMHRGWANVGLQRWDQAKQDLRDAIRIDGNRGGAHCLLARVLELKAEGDWAPSEWGLCAAMSNQFEVEPQWRAQAHERLSGSGHQ